MTNISSSLVKKPIRESINSLLAEKQLVKNLKNWTVKHVKSKNVAPLFMIILLAGTVCLLNLSGNASADANLLDSWHNSIRGGVYSEKDGVITLSGDQNSPGPVLVKEFDPQDDFVVSFDLKAETLGEMNPYPQGGGEGFNFKFCTTYGHSDPSVQFEMRARGGGQFLMVWHDKSCDQNGWTCNWEPFVYNGLGYSDGYDYWHPNPPQDRSNSTVKPDIWYTVKIKVQKEPFIVTSQVYNEQGVLLGSYRVDSINNLSFDDIHYCEMTTIQGGTFYVRNITGLTSDYSPTPSPSPSSTPDNETHFSLCPSPSQVTSLNMFALESNSTVSAFAFNNTSYELSFCVSGESGTNGYAKITIAKRFLSDAQNLQVSLDGKQLNYTLAQTEASWILNFNYNHSTHQVSVLLPKTVAAATYQLVNPASTLNQYAWIIAVAFAALLLLLLGLLLFGLRTRNAKEQ